MKILHVAPISYNKASGLTSVIPKIVIEQNKIEGIDSALLNILKIDKNIETIHKPSSIKKYFTSEMSTINNFKKLINKIYRPDLVVIHSVYSLKHIYITNYLTKVSIPYVFMPHGGLTTNALKKSKKKKKLANFIGYNKVINEAKAIQYLSMEEMKHSHKFNNEAFVIGNGVDLPSVFNERNALYTNQKVNINFIGRLDIKTKGIDYLLKLSKLTKKNLLKNNAVINIYGPDIQSNDGITIGKYIIENKLEDVVKLKGPVFDSKKENMFLETDLFILLSRNEGLPTTVLEALSYGIPCLLTPGTNMADNVEKNKCGWKTESRPEEISEKLIYILEELDLATYNFYKKNSLIYIKKHFSWETITKNTIKTYKKLYKINN